MTGDEAAGTGNTISGGIQIGPVLQGRDIQATFHLPAAAPVALAQLPPAITGFTGRDGELVELAGLLDPAGTAGPVVVSAVAGLAGVGKTTLVVQAGHAARQRGWFGGGVLFIDLHGYDEAPVESGQALDTLLRALAVPAEHIPPGAEERAGLYRSVLAEVSDPVLVIADNASSEAQVRPLLPGAGPHKVLVTSRHTLAWLGARLVNVTVLDDDVSVELLDTAVRAARSEDDRISGDQDAAGRLAGVCGGLPLALQITAALLKADPALRARELAEELAVAPERLEQLWYDDGAGPSVPSVAAAFELSYRKLGAVPARVFRLLPVNPGPDISTAATAILADLPVSKVRGVLAGLAQAHMVEAAPGVAGRWRMHDLLRLYAQRLSDDHADADGREHACDRLLDYYLRTAHAADQHVRALPGMAVPEDFTGRDAALAWLDAERASLVAAVSMAADTGRDQVALNLPHALAEYFSWRRRFDDWLTTAAVGLNAANNLGDRNARAGALNSFGLALQAVRRFEEAIAAHRDAAAIFRATGQRHGEGMASHNLGMALEHVRRFDEAITAYLQDLAVCREYGDRNGEGQTLNNLGIVLREADRFEEAVAAHRDARAIAREFGDRHGEGLALNNLASALSCQAAAEYSAAEKSGTIDNFRQYLSLRGREARRIEEAIACSQEAIAILRETGDRHNEGMALMTLSGVLKEEARLDETIACNQDAAAIFREIGDRHAEGMALHNLAIALRSVGRLDEAFAAEQDTAAIFHQTGDRYREGLALDNLGMSLREADRLAEAITAHQDAAVIFRETGDRHDEGRALHNLAYALGQAGVADAAITANDQAVVIFRETGDRHEEGEALLNQAVALHNGERFDAAITAAQDARVIFGEIRDRHNEGLALHNLGMTLRRVDRLNEAITAQRDAVAIFQATGDLHGKGRALLSLGLALKDADRFDEAITAQRDAAAIFQATGDLHYEGSALYSLGFVLQDADRLVEAINAFREAADLFRRVGDEQARRWALDNLKKAKTARRR
jgi:tetratricopeptide (TPR) repeat protein